jgi:hypothetical protein
LSHEYDLGTWSVTGRSSPNFTPVHAAATPPPVPVAEVVVAPVDEVVSPVEAVVAVPPEPPLPVDVVAVSPGSEEQAASPAEVKDRTAKEVIRARFTPPP